MIGVSGSAAAGILSPVAANNGTIGPDQWAEQTVKQLVEIVPSESDARAHAAMTLKADLTECLRDHFQWLQNNEKRLLWELGDLRNGQPLVPSCLDTAMTSLADIFGKSPWAITFIDNYKPIRELIARNFATAMNIERQWFMSCGHG
jgi:hypothetical protein